MSDDLAQRELMRAFLDRLERAMSKMPTSAFAAALEVRDIARDADAWARGLGEQDALLVLQFRAAMVSFALAYEDILRLFPEDPPDSPVAHRAGELTGRLLPELREILAEEPKRPIH